LTKYVFAIQYIYDCNQLANEQIQERRMADKKSWINIQADTELVVMLDQMVYEAEMETDHSNIHLGTIAVLRKDTGKQNG